MCAASAIACDLPPGPSPPAITETFTGSIVTNGSSVYTFTVFTAGTVSVQLSEVQPLATAMGLALGTPKNGVDCVTLSANPESVAKTAPQISVTTNPGTYCVQLFDTGHVSGSASFSVIIRHG